MFKDIRSNLSSLIVREATKICEENKNGIVKPYHMLLAIVQDPEAKIFLENLDFDFDRLKRAIDFADIELETFPYMDDDKPAVISTDVMGIVQLAERWSNAMDRPWAGYADILMCLANMGDDDTTYILDRVMDFDEGYLDKLTLHENAEWTPHMKIVPKASKEFKKVSNDNKQTRREILKGLNEDLKAVVFDQDGPIDEICAALRLAEAGMKDEDTTMGNFLLNGPTGVGKTEICKQIAKKLDMDFVRIDMSEFMEKHTVSKLISAPPGYVGHDSKGQLTGPVQEANEADRYVLVLMDEVDKAHPRVFDTLLQVMDAARLTDGKGKTADFRKVLLVMTSNIGEHQAAIEAELKAKKHPMGFGTGQQEEFNDVADDSIQNKAVNETFSPEFRNRLDGIFRLNPLGDETVKKIAQKFIDEMHELPAAKKFNLSFGVSEEALLKFVEDGHDPKMGARPMKRLIKKEFRQKVADLILDEGVSNEHIVIDYCREEGKYKLDRNAEHNQVLMLTHDAQQDNKPESDAPDLAAELS